MIRRDTVPMKGTLRHREDTRPGPAPGGGGDQGGAATGQNVRGCHRHLSKPGSPGAEPWLSRTWLSDSWPPRPRDPSPLLFQPHLWSLVWPVGHLEVPGFSRHHVPAHTVLLPPRPSLPSKQGQRAGSRRRPGRRGLCQRQPKPASLPDRRARQSQASTGHRRAAAR